MLVKLSRELGRRKENIVDVTIVLNEKVEPVDLWCGPARARWFFVKRRLILWLRAADPDVRVRHDVELADVELEKRSMYIVCVTRVLTRR